jgi:hypothetical protein
MSYHYFCICRIPIHVFISMLPRLFCLG